MNQILMLNAAYMPVGLVSWMRAICLLVTGRAEVVEGSGKVVRSPTTEVELPAILRLTGKPRFFPRRVRLSRRNLLARDDHTCQYCARQLPPAGLNMDHVVPRAQGGPTRWENVVTACVRCNDRKGPRTPEQAGFRLLKEPEVPRWTIGQELRRTRGEIPEAGTPYRPAIRNRRAP